MGSWVLGDPGSGSKVWEALDRAISESGKNRGQILAHWEFRSTAALHDRKDRRDLRSRLWAADVDPVPPSDCDWTHGVLRKIIAQLQFGIFQEPRQLLPQGKRVVAGLGQRATGRCGGACRFDLLPDLIQ